MSSRAGDFSKKTFETFMLRLFAQALSIAAGIIIARSLGPSGKGTFAYATTVLALLVTLSGGASAAVSRQYGRLREPSGAVYRGMVRFFALVCLPVSALLAAVGIFAHQPALLAPAAAFPFAYINQVTLAFSLSDGNVRWANVQGLLVAAALAIAAGVLCIVFHLGVFAVLLSWVAVYAALSIYSIGAVRRYASNPGTALQRRQLFGEQIRFGARVTVNQLLASLNYQIDIFIVLALLGHAQLGVYSVAVGLGQMMWFLSRPLAVTSYGAVTSGSPQEAARVTMLCVRHAFFTVGIASLGLLLAGPWLIVLVYGPSFHQAGLALQWLLPGILAYCVVPFFSQYFTLQLGRPEINTGITVLSIALCAGITYALAPRLGIIAGSIGTSLSYMASLAVSAFLFQRHTNIRLRELVAFNRSDARHYTSLARWIARGFAA